MTIKHDQNKPNMQLVLGGFAIALMEVSLVGTMGAEKYTPGGWKTVPNGRERYTSAMLRHWAADASGELKDPESGISHLAHMAWNALAILQLGIEEEDYVFLEKINELREDYESGF